MASEGSEVGKEFEELVSIVAKLRSEDGCPWDRAQTPQSVKRCIIEEAYEVTQAIDENDVEKLREELGDLLLQVVFQAQMASESGHFNIKDVICGLRQKLISRHPHVFGEAKAETPEEVLKQWQEIKHRERFSESTSLMDNLTISMPALMLAEDVQKRAATVGFDWESAKEALVKVNEEVKELERLLELGLKGPDERLMDEVGDILFSVVNVARLLKLDPEEALRKTVQKFVKRFKAIEERARLQGISLSEMSMKEMDAIWEEAKSQE
jgi:tetrapyrrole methylase family protein/MazG family protein